jgi:alpha-D-ribose 1-methylphosphonate 5-phosphate C-P lyase
VLLCLPSPVRKYISLTNGIDQITNIVTVRIMKKDITGVIRSLHTTTVSRCRERLEEAALRAREAMCIKDTDAGEEQTPGKPENGITSVLKRRHGL